MNSPANISLLAPDRTALEDAGGISAGWAPVSQVLIVSSDAKSADRCCMLAESLGYVCDVATDALGALRWISTDSSIGIVLVDLKLENPDGMFVLNEIAERFAPTRPMITVAMGGELSIEAIRAGASDFLTTPIAVEDLSHSLRRAASRWTTLAQQFRLNSASSFVVPTPPAQPASSSVPMEPTSTDLQDLGMKIIKSRQSRHKFIDSSLLNEATWGIMLDLAVAGLKGERVATSSACAATQVPLSTALRHVNQMIAAGLIKRVGDTKDRRRTFLELRPEAFDLMIRYLRSTWELHQTKLAQPRNPERQRFAA